MQLQVRNALVLYMLACVTVVNTIAGLVYIEAGRQNAIVLGYACQCVQCAHVSMHVSLIIPITSHLPQQSLVCVTAVTVSNILWILLAITSIELIAHFVRCNASKYAFWLIL